MSSNTSHPANFFSTPSPFGIFSNLSPEIRTMIWSHILQDTTITHSMRTRSFTWSQSAILRTSPAIRSEVTTASKLHGIHTFPGAWHFEYYLARVHDTTTIPHHIRLHFHSPKFSNSHRRERQPLIRRAIADGLRAWHAPLKALPSDGFGRRTLILDITAVPDIQDNTLYLAEFKRFVRLLALRERMRYGGRCRIGIVGPCDGEMLGVGVGPWEDM